MILKPTPTSAAPISRGASRPPSAALRKAQAASSSTKISVASGVLLRSTATETEVIARARAASSPAPAPNERRTRWKSSTTAARPARICGRTTAKPLTPSSAAESVCSQSPAGGLSTETEPPGSAAAKKKFNHDCSMLATAAV